MMRIALRHHRRLVSEEPLHLVEIDSRLDQPRREGVAEVMEMAVHDARLCRRRWLGSNRVPARLGKTSAVLMCRTLAFSVRSAIKV